MPPDINKSDLIFKPEEERNAIIYGLKGITRISDSLIKDITKNRPFLSIKDFLEKVKCNKIQVLSLLKSGAFDSICGDRTKAMDNYIDLITDKKKRITMQNMSMLVNKDLIPKELAIQKRLFNFNKYLKGFKKNDYYILDKFSFDFFTKLFDEEELYDIEVNGDSSRAKIRVKTWDKIYKTATEPMKNYMKEHQQEFLESLNSQLIKENKEKYAEGNISRWEMDSLSFYYHEHELSKLKKEVYGISDYSSLPEAPNTEKSFKTKEGKDIPIFKITRIAGTIIDKNKIKSEITLLTPDSVVCVKIWKNQFAKWDKQIAENDKEGVKHIIEKSWFTKGNKMIITGFRRGDNFVPKIYKSTEYPLFELIDEIDERGFIIKSRTDRIDSEEE